MPNELNISVLLYSHSGLDSEMRERSVFDSQSEAGSK